MANNDFYTDLTVSDGSRIILEATPAASQAAPTISFGDGDSGFFERSDDDIRVSIAGSSIWEFSSNCMGGVNAGNGHFNNETSTTTNPTVIPYRNDPDTGIGGDGSNTLSLIAGGTQALSLTSTTATTSGSVTITTIDQIGSDTDKFLMSDSGVVKYVTGANLLSYIGGTTGSGYLPLSAGSGYPLTDSLYIESAGTPQLHIKDTTNNLVGRFRVGNSSMYIDADSGEGVASTTMQLQVDAVTKLQITETVSRFQGSNVSIRRDDATPVLNFERNDATIVSGNDLGQIQFKGADPSGYNEGARMSVEADGTWQTDIFPTRIKFEVKTTDTLLTALKINSDAEINLGQYGSGTFTGTSAYYIISDSSGNLIEKTPAEVLSDIGAGTGSGTMSSFTLTGDSGSNQTIENGNTLDIAGGTNISTVVGATDTVTINMDAGGAGAGTYGSTSNSTKIDEITLDAYGRVTAVSTGATGDMTGFGVAAVESGSSFTISNGETLTLIGGTAITSVLDSGAENITFNLDDTAVSAGSYTLASITVDAQGRITSASSGSSGSMSSWKIGSTSGTDQSVTNGQTVDVVGGTGITGSVGGTRTVTLDLDNTAVSAGSYTYASITVDAQGRLTSASSGSSPGTMSSFTLAGDSGANQTISDGNTMTIAGGTALSSVGSATDTLTLNLDNTAVSAGSYTYASITVDAQGRLTSASSGSSPGTMSSWTLSGDSGSNQTISNGNTVDIAGGTYISTAASATDTLTVSHDATSRTDTTSSASPGYGGSVDIVDSVTTNATGHVTAINVETVTFPSAESYSWTLTGDSGSQTIANGNTVDIAGGTAITTAASATDTLTINLDNTAVTAGSYTHTSLTVDAQGRITAASSGSAGGTMSSFEAAGDSGSAQTITNGNTLSVLGGTKISTVASATDDITVGHDTTSRSDTSSSASPGSAGTFTAVDSVTTDTTGHITALNLKTVTMPTVPTSDNYNYWTLAGDSGSSQTISSTNTATIAGGTGLSSVASATDTVTINLDNTAVTAGSYTSAAITVDAQGRITAASSGSPGDVTGVTASTNNSYLGINVASPTGPVPDVGLNIAGLTELATPADEDYMIIYDEGVPQNKKITLSNLLPTVNNKTITLTAGAGLTGSSSFTLNQASNQTITFSLDISSLTLSTTAGDADLFAVSTSMGSDYKIAPGNINLSTFNNDSGWTSNAGTVTGSGSSGRVAYWNSSSGITSDSDLTFDGSDLTIGGDLTVSGGDITTNGVKTISNASSSTTLVIGDVDGNDTLNQIEFHSMATNQMTVDDGDIFSYANFRMTTGFDIHLQGDANILLDTSIAANQSSGTVLPLGSTTVTVNKVYYWKSTSVWELTNPNAEATSTGLIAYANSSGSSSSNRMVLSGIVFDAGHSFTVGAPLYLSTSTNGDLTTTAPSGNNDVARVVGYAITTDEIYFNPDNTWVKVTA